MKKLFRMLGVVVLTFFAVNAKAIVFTPLGPITLKWTAITQATDFEQVGGKTNQTANSTNITTLIKGTIAKTPFSQTDLMALLENSFNTNFPAGSQLGMHLGHIYVVDGTGTNVVFDLSPTLAFQNEENLSSGTETRVVSQKTSGTQVSGNFSEVFTASVILKYDDISNSTHDGTHTQFAFKGLMTYSLSENLKTSVYKAVVEFSGTGGGPVRNVPTILTGTVSGKASGSSVGF